MTLSLSSVANVVYNLPAVGGTRRGFNLGLILDDSGVISTSDRVAIYESLADMADAGHSTLSDAYLAAQAYFAASGSPSQVAIGTQASGETVLAALQACRDANSDWYMCYAPGANNSDHAAVAAWIEALTSLYSIYILQNSETAVKNDTSGNLFATLSAADYRRTLGVFSSSDHTAAAVMGYAMANTLDNAGSAYTLKFKSLSGVTEETLTATQAANIQDNNGNIYIQRSGQDPWFENGVVFDGTFFDEVIGLDKLVNDIQVTTANLLYQTPSIPQTEDGVALIRSAVGRSCERSKVRGFLANGTWSGQSILDLANGDLIPGYRVMSDPVSGQSDADRAARRAPNIYAAVKLAGSIHSVFIQVNVNR